MKWLHNDWSSVRTCNYAMTITWKNLIWFLFCWTTAPSCCGCLCESCYCCIKILRYYRERAKSITDNLPVIMHWQLVFYSIWDFVISLCDSRKEEKRDWNGKKKKNGNWYFAVDLELNVHLWQHLDLSTLNIKLYKISICCVSGGLACMLKGYIISHSYFTRSFDDLSVRIFCRFFSFFLFISCQAPLRFFLSAHCNDLIVLKAFFLPSNLFMSNCTVLEIINDGMQIIKIYNLSVLLNIFLKQK